MRLPRYSMMQVSAGMSQAANTPFPCRGEGRTTCQGGVLLRDMFGGLSTVKSTTLYAISKRTDHRCNVNTTANTGPDRLDGAQRMLQTLIDLGVDTIFGYPGGAVLPLYDALYSEPRIRHILVRHEQGAVHAAEGYARSTGKPGVVLVTSGPGMANTTSGLLDAMCDSIPVLCISGQVATTAIGTDAFQECDAVGISRPVTKWNVQIRRGEDIAAVTAKAYRMTTQG